MNRSLSNKLQKINCRIKNIPVLEQKLKKTLVAVRTSKTKVKLTA